MLAETEQRYGLVVAGQKRGIVMHCIQSTLARFPGLKAVDVDIGCVVYPVSKTAWSILYDFDEQELRVHFIVYATENLEDLDPHSAEW